MMYGLINYEMEDFKNWMKENHPKLLTEILPMQIREGIRHILEVEGLEQDWDGCTLMIDVFKSVRRQLEVKSNKSLNSSFVV